MARKGKTEPLNSYEDELMREPVDDRLPLWRQILKALWAVLWRRG